MRDAVILLVICAVLTLGGYTIGREHERAHWELQVIVANAQRDSALSRLDGLAAGLVIANAERDALAAQLEELAHEDVDAARVALPSRSVRRIGSR